MTSNMQLGHRYSLQTELIGGLVASVQTTLLAEQFTEFKIPILSHNDSGLIFCKLVNPLPSDLHSAEGELFKQSGIRGSHYYVRLKTWIV